MNLNFKYNDIDINLINTQKFKSSIIYITFEGKFDKETIANKNVLHLILEDSSSTYDTKSKNIARCQELYNSAIDLDVDCYNETLLTTFCLEVIDFSLINKEELLYEALDYFKDFIFNPNTENGLFKENIFKEKKRSIIDSIKKSYNNKGRYAVKKLLSNMCQGEILSIPTTGSIEEIEKVTLESLKDTYEDMIMNEKVSVTIVGNITKDASLEITKYLFREVYSKNRRNQTYSTYSKNVFDIEEVRHFSETQQINQSRLVMGFRTNVNLNDKHLFSLNLFNNMFGGLYSSNLYQRVREELSLAYSIYSDYYSIEQLFLVSAGIDAKDAELVENIVIEELKKYQSGQVSDKLLEEVKKFIISDIDKLNDSNYRIANYYYKEKLLGTNETMHTKLEKYLSVTKEDIIEVSNLIYLDSVFILKGENNEEDND